MDIMSSCEMIQSIKNRAIDSMNSNIGDIVLEAGCGHGNASSTKTRSRNNELSYKAES